MVTLSHLHPEHKLGKIQNIVMKDLSHFVSNNCCADKTLADGYINALNQEVEKIKKDLTHAILRYPKLRVIKTYVIYHQHTLIDLAGHLLTYTLPRHLITKPDPSRCEFFSYHTFQVLQHLLDFLQQQFAQHFVIETWVPTHYREIAICDIGHNLPALSHQLAARLTDHELLNICLQPLQQFSNRGHEQDITYQHIQYLKELKAELTRIAYDPAIHNVPKALHRTLLHLNFNAAEYHTYFIQTIKNAIRKEELGYMDQISQLHRFRKIINQQKVKKDVAFNPNEPPIAQQLTQWINEEAEYTAFNMALEKQRLENTCLLTEGYKVKTNLSVYELAYFVRLLMEAKVIFVDKVTHFLKFLSLTHETKDQKSFSDHSIRNKFYDIERSTLLSMKRILQKMLEIIEEALPMAR